MHTTASVFSLFLTQNTCPSSDVVGGHGRGIVERWWQRDAGLQQIACCEVTTVIVPGLAEAQRVLRPEKLDLLIDEICPSILSACLICRPHEAALDALWRCTPGQRDKDMVIIQLPRRATINNALC